MILVDTSVWIDHFRSVEMTLRQTLEDHQVLIHPLVVGELACGNFQNRREIFYLLDALPVAPIATDKEARNLIEDRCLMGCGISFIDVHLLAATALTGDARLWTRDKPLASIAQDMDLGHPETSH